MTNENKDNGSKFSNKPPKLDLGGKGKKPKFNPYWFYGILIGGILLVQIFMSTGNPAIISQGRFQQMLKDGDIAKVVLVSIPGTSNGNVEIYLKKEKLDKYKEDVEKSMSFSSNGPHFYFPVPSVENFEKRFYDWRNEIGGDAVNVELGAEVKKDSFSTFLFTYGPIILIIVLWVWFFRRMGRGAGGGGAGGIFSVGKSQAKLFDKDAHVTTSFKDVAGLAEAKQEVEEVVEFLKNPLKYTKLGGKIPKGALLVGPPGTGKTLLAKAVAGEANVPFFSMSGSDFVEMFVGVGASRVRDLFKQAKEKAPCIVFIDEIDAIGRARGRNPNMGANDERENTLNQLLTEMDGFDTNSGVIILAATNRADILDRALMRAGRFDRQIHVELPDLNERKEIFQVHLRPLKISPKVEVKFLAKQTPGFSGADIANVCNEAALIAARQNKEAVEKQDFLDAVDRIIGGLEKKNKIISPEEKSTIAYHEAGHASVSWLLEHAHPLVKVTIVPRGKALGAAWYLPDERSITTKEQMLDEMCSTLGGRAAEELVFGKISSGAQNDLERVTKQAYAMVSIFGMSDVIGNMSYFDSSGQTDFSFSKPYSEKTAELIDKEAKKLIDGAYKRALEILRQHKEGHKKLSEQLLEREVIFSEDLEAIFGPRKNSTQEEKEEVKTTVAKKKKAKKEDTSEESKS